ncbi:MAG TPA: hypothetical protein VK111_08845 [Virgibacillus sp.]|nr:hypothetical protein [Virgibacillus sp.]
MNITSDQKIVEINQRQMRKENYIRKNYLKWNEEGKTFRDRRMELGLSLRDVGKILGTSATRIRRFEIGDPVSQARHLKASYELLFKHIGMREQLKELIEMNYPGINITGVIDFIEGGY